jgi:hypothetical protein
MFILGWLVNIVTFPGVVLHESAHKFFCDISKVKVHEVSYFRFGDPSGYVLHGEVDSLRKSFAISIGPLLINTLACAILCFPVGLAYFILEIQEGTLALNILGWIGFSCGMHAFPSNQDVTSLTENIKSSKKGLLYFSTLSFALLIKLANLLSFFWFDLIYAIGISMAIPYFLLKYV